MRRVSWFIVSGLLFPITPLFAGLATAYQDTTHFYLENDALKIAVLRSTGNLDGIVHKQSRVNLQSNTENDYPAIWGMSLRTPTGTNFFVSSGQAINFSGATSTTANGATLALTWKGLQYLPNGLANIPNVTISAQISVRTDSPLSYWTIQATGLATISVTYINFPSITGIGPLGQSGEDDALLTSEFKGTLYHNPTATVPAGTYLGGFYPSATGLMQLLAYFDPSSGFYFASDDTQGNTKDYYWGKSSSPAGDFTINMEYFPPGQPADTVSLPYNVLVGVTQGDWYAPADMYRSWATQQQWAQQSRMKQIPAWLHDLPLIRNTCAHGCGSQPDQTYASAAQEWQQSQQALGVTALGELWGWEQFGEWAEGDYFPPHEGWSSFDAMIHSVPSSRLYVLPSALFLDTSTSLYKSGTMAASAMVDQAGKVRTQVGAAALKGDSWAFMDVSTDPWRQYIVGIYQTLAQHGVDLIQFDSSMEAGPQPCYNPAHSHPPGEGGNWQTLAWIDIAQITAIAVAAANPDAALSAEEPAEVYLPYFAVHSGSAVDQYEQGSQFTTYKEPVPLFQYVYHDSILFDDFFSPPVLDGSYFRLALARDLTWGQIPDYQIPTGYTPTLESMAEAYLKSAITARTTYAKKFLVDGVMLPAPQLTVPTTKVSWIDFSHNNAQVTAQYPSVQESAWRASDGSIGIVMTNISPNNLTFSLRILYNRLGLSSGAAYVVEAIGSSSSAILDLNLTSDSTYSLTLSSQEILVVTLTLKALRPCTYGLNLGGQGFSAQGGTGTITITTDPGCPWTVSNLPTWITLTSAASGVGSRTVTFQVASNTGGDLAASFSIAGQNFTVEQEASSIPGLASAGSLAQVASEGTWTFSLDAINLGPSAAKARFSFSDNSGNPLPLPLLFPQNDSTTAPMLASTLDRTINNNAQLVIESTGPDSAPSLVGWGQLLTDGSISGFGIFSNPTSHWSAVVPLEARNARSYMLAFDNTGSLATGVAVANVSIQAASINVIIRDDTGSQIGRETINLAAQGHTSFMLNQQYSVTAAKRGTIEFDTPQGDQISVLGLRANGSALTTLPVLANVGTNGGSITHATFNGGFTCTFYLVNTGPTSAQFTLSFFDEGGNALQVPLSLPESGTATTTAALTQTLAAGAMLVFQTQAQDALPSVVGSAQLTTTGNISGFEIFRWTTFGQEASVPLETRTPNSFVLVFDDTNGLTTGVALANLAGSAAGITLNLRDDRGALLQTAAIALAARGHKSFLLPTKYALTESLRGSAEFVVPTGGKISVIGLRAKSDGTLTTIPVLAK